MKQRTAAPQTPTVAYARACDASATAVNYMGIGGLGFCSNGGATTVTNLSTRRLGMRPT